jgi:hypothetical protein
MLVRYPSGTLPSGDHETEVFLREEESEYRGYKITCGPDTKARREALKVVIAANGIRSDEYEVYWSSIAAENSSEKDGFDRRIKNIKGVQLEQRRIVTQSFLRRSGVAGYLRRRNARLAKDGLDGMLDPTSVTGVELELFSTTPLPVNPYVRSDAIFAGFDPELFEAVASQTEVTKRDPKWRRH